MQHPPGFCVIRVDLHGARGFAVFDGFLRGGQQAVLLRCVFIVALDLADQTGAAFFDAFQIGKHQFCIDGLGVCHGVHAPFDVGHIAVFKAAQHMGDRVRLADIG